MSAPDKTLLAVTVASLCLILALAFIMACQGPINVNNRPDDWQEEQVLAIALNDTVALDKLRDLESKFYWQDGMIFNTTNPQFYRIGGVAVDQCHEVAPGLDRTRYLPCVELVMGNESQGDLNVYLFVDPGRERVAYIGYTNRSGPDAGQYRYAPVNGGVAGYAHGYLAKGYDNVTLVDTGYGQYQAFNATQQSRLLEIARDNSTVDKFLEGAAERGETYELSGWIQSTEGELGGYRYITAYQMMHIGTKKPDGSSGYEYLLITIDGNRGAVMSVEKGEIISPRPHPYW